MIMRAYRKMRLRLLINMPPAPMPDVDLFCRHYLLMMLMTTTRMTSAMQRVPLIFF